jgi:hypothetical protein
MNLIWKLLRRHISVGQLAGFFLADLVGTVIVLCGIQIYSDMAPMLSGSDGLLGNDYIVISKPVKQLGSLMGRSAAHFSESDIDDLKAQPFARNVGEFRSSQYGVYLGLPGVFATDMFFESVPDRFIDVTTDEWRFDRSKRDIPIILPRNYLNLYNFGFAQTKGLPQLSEGVSQSISFDIELSGSGRTEHFKGHVVGFSDRLNTVLVPESFMEWANDRFAPSKSALASRLIVEVENPADESIAAYLQQRGYEVENNAADNSKIGFLLKIVVSVVMAIGLIISILAIYILTLSIYLLLQKNTDKLENLSLLGYSARRIAAPYSRLTVTLNVAIMLLAIAAVYFVREAYMTRVAATLGGASQTGFLPTIIAGALLTAVVVTFDSIVIRRKINSIASKR